MEIGEILDIYEGLWQQAALEDRHHFSAFHGKIEGTTGDGECAASLRSREFDEIWQILFARGSQTCPECPRDRLSVAGLMTHLNDEHLWTWDMFANKFRGLVV